MIVKSVHFIYDNDFNYVSVVIVTTKSRFSCVWTFHFIEVKLRFTLFYTDFHCNVSNLQITFQIFQCLLKMQSFISELYYVIFQGGAHLKYWEIYVDLVK